MSSTTAAVAAEMGASSTIDSVESDDLEFGPQLPNHDDQTQRRRNQARPTVTEHGDVYQKMRKRILELHKENNHGEIIRMFKQLQQLVNTQNAALETPHLLGTDGKEGIQEIVDLSDEPDDVIDADKYVVDILLMKVIDRILIKLEKMETSGTKNRQSKNSPTHPKKIQEETKLERMEATGNRQSRKSPTHAKRYRRRVGDSENEEELVHGYGSDEEEEGGSSDEDEDDDDRKPLQPAKNYIKGNGLNLAVVFGMPKKNEDEKEQSCSGNWFAFSGCS